MAIRFFLIIATHIIKNADKNKLIKINLHIIHQKIPYKNNIIMTRLLLCINPTSMKLRHTKYFIKVILKNINNNIVNIINITPAQHNVLFPHHIVSLLKSVRGTVYYSDAVSCVHCATGIKYFRNSRSRILRGDRIL